MVYNYPYVPVLVQVQYRYPVQSILIVVYTVRTFCTQYSVAVASGSLEVQYEYSRLAGDGKRICSLQKPSHSILRVYTDVYIGILYLYGSRIMSTRPSTAGTIFCTSIYSTSTVLVRRTETTALSTRTACTGTRTE